MKSIDLRRLTKLEILAIVAIALLGLATVIYISRDLYKMWYGPDGYLVTACESNLDDIKNAVNGFAKDHGGAYPGKISDLAPSYAIGMPDCPAAHRDTYSAGYITNGRVFTVECAGNNHSRAGLPPNYPQYSSVVGKVLMKP